MKISNQVKIYINVALLFLFTFVFTKRLISGIQNNDFNYTRLLLTLLAIVFTIMQIIKYSKIENNK